MAYHFTKKAVDDLTKIWNYTIEEWSEKQAEKYYNLIISTCEEIAKNPGLGKSYDIVSNNVMGYRCGAHIIFYSIITNKQILIIRILHQMMDLKSRI